MRKFWSDAEDQALKRLYPQAQWREILVAIPGRTIQAIHGRAQQIKISRLRTLPNRSKRSWTTEDEAVLRSLYPRASNEELMRFIPNKNLSAIRQRANKLGARRVCRASKIVRLKSFDDASAGYLAAIIDGEGSIGLERGKRYGYFLVRISVGNTHQGVIDWIHQTTGIGGLSKETRRFSTKFGKKPMFYWKTSRLADALALLRRIRPWLIIKARNADILLQAEPPYTEEHRRLFTLLSGRPERAAGPRLDEIGPHPDKALSDQSKEPREESASAPLEPH